MNIRSLLPYSKIKSRRAIIAWLGVIILIVWIINSWVNLSDNDNSDQNNILLPLTACLLILSRWIDDKRSIVWYRNTAIMLLNTLILLAFMELGVRSVIEIKNWFTLSNKTQAPDHTTKLPYYASQEWSELYWREFKNVKTREQAKQYSPWVIWHHSAYKGKTININEDGIRRTPTANCSSDAYKVFAFGGSTMWGSGAPDWGTIAAYIQNGLQSILDKPVCVVNFGEPAYVSTQGVIALLIQLQSGNVPDMVIFYDGVNDVLAAYPSGQSGVHFSLRKIAAKVEGKNLPFFLNWLMEWKLYKLITKIASKLMPEKLVTSQRQITYETMGIDANKLASSITKKYLGNYKIVKALSMEYSFEFKFFWQPVLLVGDKTLTSEELTMMDGSKPALSTLFHAVYHQIFKIKSKYQELFYLAHIFDNQEKQIWIDMLHVTPEGNQLVAKEMLNALPLPQK